MEHQERALGAYVEQVKGEPGTLGVVVVGSVARGEEREDSDVDVYLVVDADRFAELAAADRWAWVDRVGLDYPGSYIDVKATDLAYLRAVLIGHHRMGARIPFDQRSSGQPATT